MVALGRAFFFFPRICVWFIGEVGADSPRRDSCLQQAAHSGANTFLESREAMVVIELSGVITL